MTNKRSRYIVYTVKNKVYTAHQIRCETIASIIMYMHVIFWCV